MKWAQILIFFREIKYISIFICKLVRNRSRIKAFPQVIFLKKFNSLKNVHRITWHCAFLVAPTSLSSAADHTAVCKGRLANQKYSSLGFQPPEVWETVAAVEDTNSKLNPPYHSAPAQNKQPWKGIIRKYLKTQSFEHYS